MGFDDLARRGEDAAAAFLERTGMRIERRNWRCGAGEIDIIARDGETLVLCEVKTRRSQRAGSAEDAVSPTKQRRIVRIAQAYVSTGEGHAGPIRFDVVAIRVIGEDRALLRHYRGAFEQSA